MSLNDILRIIRDNRYNLKKLGLECIGIFGSYVRGDEHLDSDLDFIAIFERGKKNYDNYFELYEFLKHIFQKKIDLLTPESISPYIKDYIEKETYYERL